MPAPAGEVGRLEKDIHAEIAGRLVMVGFGSIGQGVLPLILRHLAVDRDRITIFTAEERGRDVAQACGIRDFRVQDRKSTRLNSSHPSKSRMPSSA